jgi:hypothetical protein
VCTTETRLRSRVGVGGKRAMGACGLLKCAVMK